MNICNVDIPSQIDLIVVGIGIHDAETTAAVNSYKSKIDVANAKTFRKIKMITKALLFALLPLHEQDERVSKYYKLSQNINI